MAGMSYGAVRQANDAARAGERVARLTMSPGAWKVGSTRFCSSLVSAVESLTNVGCYKNKSNIRSSSQ